MFDTQKKLGSMQLVERRDRNTLLPIIAEHTLPGTIIHSDCWAAYNRVGDLLAVDRHMSVNHIRYFVDPQTGVHTQAMESYWGRAKAKLKRMRDTTPDLFRRTLTNLCGGKDTEGMKSDSLTTP